MQPLNPDERQALRREHPLAAPEDLDRYEQLLSMRFTQDPNRPQAGPEAHGLHRTIEQELQELHRRIFETPNDASAATE
jgi:hypothetical protein